MFCFLIIFICIDNTENIIILTLKAKQKCERKIVTFKNYKTISFTTNL
jgi:hypothetical protein